MPSALRGLLTFLTALFLTSTAHGQVSQNTWLLGGTGAYYVQKFKVDAVPTKRTTLRATSNAGYFVWNQLAVGVKGSFWYDGHKGGVANSRTYYTTLAMGPFVRYYILPDDRQLNFLGEGAYQYAPTWTHDGGGEQPQHVYSLAAGPVYYFTTSVVMELLLGYEVSRSANYQQNWRNLRVSVGLQFYLQREEE